MTEDWWWAITIGVVLLIIAWYLSYSAARLDRLHARAEGALAALDAQLVRRAEATLELANSGGLDPASSLLLASAASESLDLHPVQTVADDPLDGVQFAGRESVEADLTAALHAALTPPVIQDLTSRNGVAGAALERVDAAATRVQMARQFHNNAVRDVHRMRAKPVVRLFHLAGHASNPGLVEFDDARPGSGQVPA
ncbi:MAG: hypothetical protein ACK5MP_02445 [Nostocoides sp.]